MIFLGGPYIVFISTSGMLRSSDIYIYIYIYIYIQCQPKETERLSPGAKMVSFWKDKDLPRIAIVNAYVSVSSMDR